MAETQKIPCIANMIAIMGEKMTADEAQVLLDEAVRRTKLKAAADSIPEAIAARRVAAEMKQEQKMLNAQTKRRIPMDAGARMAIENFAKTGDAKTYGKNIRKLLQKVEDLGNQMGSKDEARFFADISEKGIGPEWLSRKLSYPIMQELEQLNFKMLGMESKPGISGSKQAQDIAQAFFDIRINRQAVNNRWGANVEEVEGYMFKQTTSSERLRMAGQRFVMFSKESQAESYRVWREFIDTLEVDWERTHVGNDVESFLKGYHNNQYSGVHGDAMDQGADLEKFKRVGGSLADKLSSQRVLWFKNADSAYKYNQRWGTADVQHSMLNNIRSGARSTAMLQQLGTRPADNIELVRRRLVDEAKNLPNAQDQVQSLSPNYLRGQMDLLTGRANISNRPWLSATVDFLKAWTLAAKGTGIVFSAISDRAFMNSRMHSEGLGYLDSIGAQAHAMFRGNPRLAAEVGVYSKTMAGALSNKWQEEMRPVLYMDKAVDLSMRLQGQNFLTRAHQSGMGMMVAKKLADDAHLKFSELDPRRQQIMTEYGFSPAEWEGVRTTKQAFDDAGDVIVASGVHSIPDELMIPMLGKQKPTAANIARAKDKLEAKLDFYFGDAINEGVPTPTAGVRAIRTLNGVQRGEFSREAAELFFVFKGFPIKAALTMQKQGMSIGGMAGVGHVLMLVAQAGILGYLGMMAKDALRGKTPKSLFTKDGYGNITGIEIDTWINALARGGGLGIYGDLLLSDYDKRYKSVLSNMAGPVYGEAANAFALYGSAKQYVTGDKTAESVGYEAFKMAENNTPLMGMFPLRSAYEYFIMWNIKEALSPGVFRRQQKSMEDRSHQEYFWEPVQ
jgi:hypothetical protein